MNNCYGSDNIIDDSLIFDLIGGEETIIKLVDLFYDKIDKDDFLRPMFPENLMEGKKWQILFLTKRFGGGDNYTSIRGHPRLRKRHLPFSIGIRERNHWFNLMMETWKEIGINENHLAWTTLNDYFGRVSMKMINKMEIE